MMVSAGRPPALILAGGRSSRMGTHKAFVEIGGDTILGHILRRLAPQVSEIALNAPADFPNPAGLRLLPDGIPGQAGPLAGVLSGLRDIQARNAPSTHLLTAPCDSPFLPTDLAERLRAAVSSPEVIAVAQSAGRDHPVFGLWPLAIADDLEAWLRDPENRRLKAFLGRHRVATVDFPAIDTNRGPFDPFFNINTPEELAEARLYSEALR